MTFMFFIEPSMSPAKLINNINTNWSKKIP